MNQFAYIGLVLGFYYLKVHLPMNQIQLDTALIDEQIAAHREVYTDSQSFAIVYDDESVLPVLDGFATKSKNFLKLEAVDFIKHSNELRFGEYEFVMFVEKGSQTEVKISNHTINRFTVYYSSLVELGSKTNLEAFGYLRMIADPSYAPLSKAYSKIYVKLLYLVTDDESKALNTATLKAIRSNPSFVPVVDKSIKKIVGDHVEIVYSNNFNVKNTFGVFVNSLTPNEDVLKRQFQALLEDYDQEYVESKPTLGLNVAIESTARQLPPANKRLHAYRNAAYLKTNSADAVADVVRSLQYVMVNAFGLEKISTEMRQIFGVENYSAVIGFVNKLRERRILKTSLVFLESLRFVNENTNLAIKEEHIGPLIRYLQHHKETLKNRDYETLQELSNYNEHAFFVSTYMFESYIYGLLLIVVLSGVSPLMKVLKEELILTLVYCRRQKYLARDVNVLSSVDWFFERSFVAIDQYDYDSEDYDDGDAGNKNAGGDHGSSAAVVDDERNGDDGELMGPD